MPSQRILLAEWGSAKWKIACVTRCCGILHSRGLIQLADLIAPEVMLFSSSTVCNQAESSMLEVIGKNGTMIEKHLSLIVAGIPRAVVILSQFSGILIHVAASVEVSSTMRPPFQRRVIALI